MESSLCKSENYHIFVWLDEKGKNKFSVLVNFILFHFTKLKIM